MQDSKGILYRQEGTNEFPPTFTLLEPNPDRPRTGMYSNFLLFKLNLQIIPFYKKIQSF